MGLKKGKHYKDRLEFINTALKAAKSSNNSESMLYSPF